MTTAQTLTRELIDGTVYLSTEYRGTRYTVYTTRGAWVVMTRRMSLTRSVPGVKHFDTLEEVKAKCKAFAAVELIEAL